MRHAEPGGERGAVAVVAIEQLDHACGRPERGRTLDRLGHVDRVDQPDAVAGVERVRRARQPLARDPREAERKLVEGDGHGAGG